MSLERAPEFSPEENEDIGKLTIQMAEVGEESIYTTKGLRHGLMGEIIRIYQTNMYRPGSLEWLASMRHEVDVMDEVIRRAGAILKIQGTDLESEGERLNLAASFGRIGDSE
jgi:hypothetical protein